MKYNNIKDIYEKINIDIETGNFTDTLEEDYETALDLIDSINNLGIDINIDDLEKINDVLKDTIIDERYNELQEIFESDNPKNYINELYFEQHLVPEFFQINESHAFFQEENINDINNFNYGYNNKVDEIAYELYSLKELAPEQLKEEFDNIYKNIRDMEPLPVISEGISNENYQDILKGENKANEVKVEAIKEIATFLEIPLDSIPSLNKENEMPILEEVEI